MMVGAAFGEGTIDIWDISADDGGMKLLEQIPAGGVPGPVAGRQDSPRECSHLFRGSQAHVQLLI